MLAQGASQAEAATYSGTGTLELKGRTLELPRRARRGHRHVHGRGRHPPAHDAHLHGESVLAGQDDRIHVERLPRHARFSARYGTSGSGRASSPSRATRCVELSPLTGEHRRDARARAGRARPREASAQRLDAVGETAQARAARAGVGAADAVVGDRRRRPARLAARTSIVTRDAPACLAALASASEQTKKSAASTGAGSRRLAAARRRERTERSARSASAGISPPLGQRSRVHALRELAQLAARARRARSRARDRSPRRQPRPCAGLGEEGRDALRGVAPRRAEAPPRAGGAARLPPRRSAAATPRALPHAPAPRPADARSRPQAAPRRRRTRRDVGRPGAPRRGRAPPPARRRRRSASPSAPSPAAGSSTGGRRRRRSAPVSGSAVADDERRSRRAPARACRAASRLLGPRRGRRRGR